MKRPLKCPMDPVLAELCHALEVWRRSHPGRVRPPSDLRETATLLAHRHGCKEVASALQVAVSTVRRWRNGTRDMKPGTLADTLTLVEVSPSLGRGPSSPLAGSPASSDLSMLELRSTDGFYPNIRLTSDCRVDMGALVGAFIRGRVCSR